MSELYKLEIPSETPTSGGVEAKLPYQDPENVEEIVTTVKNCETHDEVVKLINKVFPGWIIGWPKRYSSDFPHFQNNWEYMCKKSKCRTLSIIIVDIIVFGDPKYTLVKLFCELLTVFGHSVRRKEEFVACKICGDAIPSEKVFMQLVERKITTLGCWMIKCRGC
jgi:hypothetical protein